MLNSKFNDVLTYLKGKKIIIATHDLVDIDGLASCFAFKFFLFEYLKNPNVSIFLSELTKTTKIYMSKFNKKFPNFNFSYRKDIHLMNFDVCLIIDANSISQIRFNGEKETIKIGIPYIIIDHHHYNEEKSDNANLGHLNLIDDDFSSTAEIILTFFENFSLDLPLPYKYLVITAILTDSGFFKYGTNNTIKSVAGLLGKDLNFQEVKLLLNRDVNISEKIAKIKGLQRLELIREGSYLIGITNVSSFGAKVATAIISIGCDVCITHSKEKNQYVIHSRAKKSICLKTGLHLGKIFEELSNNLGGSGGGHDGAAALTFETSLDTYLFKIVDKIKLILRSKF